MHYLLFYEVAEDYVARRAAFRDQHLQMAWEASDRGELILGGALAHPVDAAVLLFEGDSPEVAENFARSDPYVASGAVKRWYVREWTTVAGPDAATPVWPATASGPAAGGGAEAGGSIARLWRGRAAAEKAGDYVRHFEGAVVPVLQRIEGNRGAYLLRRTVGGMVEFVVITFWTGMEAVRRFAGLEPERAVADPEARAALRSFEKVATHFEVVVATEPGPGSPTGDLQRQELN